MTLRVAPAAATAIFDEDARVLLTRRADDGLWCLPSGHMDPGETVSETAVRETLEETGLEVELGRAVGVYSRPHPYFVARGVQFLSVLFLAHAVGGTLSTTSETTDVGWFPPAALPEGVLPLHAELIRDAVAARDGAAFAVR